MSKAKLTFRSALWNHAGKILEYLLMYGTSIVIARGLGAQENGRFAGLFSLSQLLLVLSSIGLETSLNKFVPQLAQEKQNEKAAYILRRALLMRIAAFFGITIIFYLAVLFLAIPFFEESRTVLLLVLVFTGVRSIFPLFAMVLTAQLRTALTARINLVVRTIELVGMVVLARFHLSVDGIFLLLLSTSVCHVIAYAALSRMDILGHVERVDMSPIILFGSIFWINTIVDFILGRQGDVLFLTNLLPDSTQAGLYDVAYSVAQLSSMAMTVGLSGVTFATFARLAISDQDMMNRFYSFSVRMISLLTIPLYAFLLFNTQAVLSVLYSPRYLAAAALIQGIVAFRMTSRLFGGPENAEYLLSHGKVGSVVVIGTISATVNIMLNIFLIPRLGASGSVIASGCANVLVNALAALVVYSISPNRVQAVFWLKLTAICLASSLACMYVIPSENVLSLIAAGLLYLCFIGGCFTLAKPLTRDDAAWLSRIHGTVQKIIQPFCEKPVQLAEFRVP